jgi:hypothetical protein
VAIAHLPECTGEECLPGNFTFPEQYRFGRNADGFIEMAVLIPIKRENSRFIFVGAGQSFGRNFSSKIRQLASKPDENIPSRQAG